jgi:cyclase
MGAPTSHGHDESLSPPHTDEVSDGIFAYIQPDGSWWINNTGFLVGRSGITSIDTCSTERRTRGFLAAIARVSPLPVRTLVSTHHHGDHTNGNNLLPGATIVGHERCREAMLDWIGHPPAGVFEPVEWGDVHPVPPFLTFADHIDLWVDDLQVELHYIGCPAHTVGDVVAWIPERRVLFAGDLLFNGGTPFVLMGSVSGSLRALERLRAFPAETIVPGHGPVCGPEVIDRVAGYLQFIDNLAKRAHAAGLTPLQAAFETDLGQYRDWLDSERLVGNLHRAYLELDGGAQGRPIDLLMALGDMIAYNGGRPLRCLA